MKLSWKQFAIALCLFLAGYLTFNSNLFAQTPEKTKVSIAVGGKNLFYYLPLTIAEQLGYFKDEGLDVQISDFAGGAKALQALIGGSADVVSGAFEHTISMQAKNQRITAFVLQGRAPQIVMGVSNKTMPNYKTIADLKGKKIGVTAPGSSTSMMSNFVLAKGGLKPTDVSYIGVGASAGALSALRSGSIDVIVNLDPLITMMQKNNEIRIISDTRTLKDTNAVFGGPMPAATLYASADFIKKYPNTTQALTNAMVRALKWLQKATPEDVAKVVPESYQLGDRDLYLDAFNKMREALSPDGMIPEEGPKVALHTLEAFDPELAGKNIDLSQTYTNEFVKKADAKYK
ncbi:NitT/TauT family transport system substrate-binding protein [Collimonas sp. PA-H2]|jgi:NitT/TauT family transport system substrate-binding protein|uniref:ABC transporter substrate-binding protein n=1 Tax=Collimonas sp. PA-H2 TaxID=1881062 RepID=UPI000BF46F0F|nr:ABC transporter substrate-binding protein [Collimonas sp. PA-H2]PFH11630.1 NitT/TauT family transport system substrate-binding protein [Collimonas sp. PA-H2]